MVCHAVRWNSSSPRLSALSLAIAIALGAPVARAATITVNDGTDPVPITSTLTCTLRQAVAAINSQALSSATGNCTNIGAFSPGASDTIIFKGGLTAVNLDGVTNGELDIKTGNDLLINGGASLGNVTVSLTSGAFSVIGNRGANASSNLTLTGLTIRDGNVTGDGGGVYLGGNHTLTLNNSVVTSNTSSGDGGGVDAYNVVLNNSTVSSNMAGSSNTGGGVYGYRVVLNNSTISSNMAGQAGGGVAGYSVALNNSLVSGNNAIVGGGVLTHYVASNHSTVSANDGGFFGGGVATQHGGIFTDSVITGNMITAFEGGPGQSYGAGIVTGGALYLTNSTISNNIVNNSYGRSYCGGISAKYQSASVTLTNSTVSGNNGGAVCAGQAILTNSTVSGNSGSYFSGISGTAVGLFNSTVSGNAGPGPAVSLVSYTQAGILPKPKPAGTKPGGGQRFAPQAQHDAMLAMLQAHGGSHAFGHAQKKHAGRVQAAGIHGSNLQAVNLSSNLTLYSSIVTQNIGASFDISASSSTTAAGGYNIIGTVSDTITITSLTHEVVGNPLLGALAGNGCAVPAGETSTAGCVQTMALLPGSPAINTGSTIPSGVTTDERGAGFPRPSGAAADIGAFERIIVLPIATPLVENVSFDTPLTFSLLGTDSNPGGPFPFTFAPVTGPTHGTISVTPGTGSTIYTPNTGYTGPDSFTFTVTDVNGTSATATVIITVAAGVLPIAQPKSASTTTNTPVAITLTATDSNPGTSPFTFAVGTPPAHGTVTLGTPTTTGMSTPASSGAVPSSSIQSGTIQFSYGIAAANGTVTATYTPASNYAGADSFTFTASNANGTSAPATVTIAVAAPAVPFTPAPAPTLSTWAWGALIAQFGLIAWYRMRRFPDAAPKKKLPIE